MSLYNFLCSCLVYQTGNETRVRKPASFFVLCKQTTDSQLPLGRASRELQQQRAALKVSQEWLVGCVPQEFHLVESYSCGLWLLVNQGFAAAFF